MARVGRALGPWGRAGRTAGRGWARSPRQEVWPLPRTGGLSAWVLGGPLAQVAGKGSVARPPPSFCHGVWQLEVELKPPPSIPARPFQSAVGRLPARPRPGPRAAGSETALGLCRGSSAQGRGLTHRLDAGNRRVSIVLSETPPAGPPAAHWRAISPALCLPYVYITVMLFSCVSVCCEHISICVTR